MDHNFGRQLPAMLTAAGLEDVENDGRAWVMQGGSAQGAHWSSTHSRTCVIGWSGPTGSPTPRWTACWSCSTIPGWAALSPIIFAAWGRKP